MAPDELERFEAKYVVDPNSGCWLWTGTVDHDGYGRLRVSGRMARAHRLAHEHFSGALDGALVLHRCDVPACVNPAHLFVGTKSDNALDSVLKGRHQAQRPGACRGERNGRARLTESAVRRIRRSRLPATDLAAEYGVSAMAICHARARRSWAEVQ